MKRLLLILSAALLLTACGESEEQPKAEEKPKAVEVKEEVKAEKAEPKEAETVTEPIEQSSVDINSEDFQSALKWWEKEDKQWWIDEHKELGVMDVQPVDEDYSFVNIIVSNELKALTDNEKELLAGKLGEGANNFIGIKFGHNKEVISQDKDIYVDILYADGTVMASQKMVGNGWKVK